MRALQFARKISGHSRSELHRGRSIVFRQEVKEGYGSFIRDVRLTLNSCVSSVSEVKHISRRRQLKVAAKPMSVQDDSLCGSPTVVVTAYDIEETSAHREPQQYVIVWHMRPSPRLPNRRWTRL